MSSFLSRRTLLRAAPGAALLPFLARLPTAHAATSPKRFVVFFSGNEPIDKAHWEPGANLALTPVMQPLEPHKSKLLLLGGLKMGPGDQDTYSGHNCIGQLLTGRVNLYFGTKSQFWAGGVSLDQQLASGLGTPALTLGARPGKSTGTARISYTGANQPVHPVEDPLKAFNQLFGTLSETPDAQAARIAQRRSVLDVLSKDLAAVRTQVPALERTKVDQHLTAVRELEQRLTAPVTTCSPTPLPGGFDFTANANFPATARRHMDVLVQALACNATRVASLQLGSSAGGGTPSWPDEGINLSNDEHDIAHTYYSVGSATAVSERRQVETFYYKLFAYFLKQLDSVQEGDGTLLDNTLVLWTKPMAAKHGHSDMLFMLGGGKNLGLRTGRFVSFPGVLHNNLLLSVLQLMGQPSNTFGDPSLCSGPLAI
jgi:hypothetical protein